MATVVAITSFVGILENDELGPDRIEKHSEFPAPSVFPGGLGFPVGSLQRNIKKPGRKIDVIKGQKYEDSHPAVRKWPAMFGKAGDIPIEVEAATAAPGEKRGR